MVKNTAPMTLVTPLIRDTMPRLIAMVVWGAVVALQSGSVVAQTQGKTLGQTQTHTPHVDVFHWWVSGGERASVDVIRDATLAQGIGWTEASTVGSGTARYTRVLEQRVRAGKTPTAAQMIGHDIHTWAARGLLANLDDLARREEWDAVVPLDIQHLSKYDGHWVATPFNTHATNWLWVNQALATRLGATAPPDTFPDLVALLEKARVAGVVPLAIGREAWEHTLLFEVVAAGYLGASAYRKAFIDLRPDVLTPEQAAAVFARMRLLSHYLDPGYKTRSWDAASDMVRAGKALLQAQGTWVNGEFTARGMVPGREYACWQFPDTQGMFVFNADQYIFFRAPVQGQNGADAFASLLMSPALQVTVNIKTGAAPARVDASPERFNACGKRAIAGLRASNMRRTVLGSIAMGNANPAAVKTAIYQVVTNHLQGKMNDEEAASLLRKALVAGARARAKERESQQ
ncbi:ABC transporter substrate-binding protein [Acidovorax radicis]|uniref:ABC transporter substrate-binding protein n=1 Tax=Acidovorax radicis TaxID=758826 RepID=UPI001CFBFABF|nr:ABC transporter substrate-binding protein [Acidovorax radicis]